MTGQAVVYLGTPRLSLTSLLLLRRQLGLLLLVLQLRLRLPLQSRLLLLRLLHWLKEALQPTLLRALQILLQLRRSAAYPVLVEMLLFNEVFDQAIDVRRLPLEVTIGVVGLPNVRMQEEFAGVGVRPVFGDGVFCAGFDVCDDAVEGLVLLDQLQGCGWADAFNGVEVVTAEENAEVDELEDRCKCIFQDDNENERCLPVPAPYLAHQAPYQGGSLESAPSSAH